MTVAVLALAFACAFVGAALYIALVEQPARLALNAQSMIQEWRRSNRRGSALLSAVAIIAAVLAFIRFGQAGDVRVLLGGLIVLLSWPYAYFVMVPANIMLHDSADAHASASSSRQLMRDWGLLEWGHVALGVVGAWFLAWALLLPAV
jgi:hypothetical protein